MGFPIMIDHAAEPLVGLLVIALLALLCKWTFARGSSLVAPPAKQGTPENYGLLKAVTPVLPEDAAVRVVNTLNGAGIRSTVTTTTLGRQVMVFDADLARAQEALHNGSR